MISEMDCFKCEYCKKKFLRAKKTGYLVRHRVRANNRQIWVCRCCYERKKRTGSIRIYHKQTTEEKLAAKKAASKEWYLRNQEKQHWLKTLSTKELLEHVRKTK